MARLQDIAELLLASWVLSDEDPADATPLPANQGVLDRALQQAIQNGAFPPSWQKRLHFVDSRVGLKCVELPSIIAVAQSAQFTSDPNPSYETTRSKVRLRAARALLRRHQEISEAQVKSWGEALHKAVADAKRTLEQFPAPNLAVE
jgi:hypothetical protein